jgi:hypothetical protein
MFDLRITASATTHTVRRECGGDWRKGAIQRALECADIGASVTLIKGGSPGVNGDLHIVCHKSSLQWLEKLADLLAQAPLSYRSEAGLGLLVEALIALGSEWQLRQQN